MRNSSHKKSGSQNLTKWIGLSKRLTKIRFISKPYDPFLAFLWPYSESFHHDNDKQHGWICTQRPRGYNTSRDIVFSKRRSTRWTVVLHTELSCHKFRSLHVQNINIFFSYKFFSIEQWEKCFPCARTFRGQ